MPHSCHQPPSCHQKVSSSYAVISCSGSSDKAALTDYAARDLYQKGLAKMICVTGLALQQPMQIKAAAKAEHILALDGCNRKCASLCLKAAGFSNVTSVVMNELGFVKGDSPATPDNIATVVNAALDRVRNKNTAG